MINLLNITYKHFKYLYINKEIEHYRTTLCQDILTLTYTHETDEKLKKTDAIRYWDNSSPYHKNRPSRPLKGNKPIRPAQEPRTHRNIPILEATIVHSMIKDAINNKTALLSMVMALHCITGLKPEIINARTGVAPWKLRTGRIELYVLSNVKIKKECLLQQKLLLKEQKCIDFLLF